MMRPGFTAGYASAALLAAIASADASSQVEYEIIDLTEAAAKIGVVQSEARGVNERNQVVGFEVVESFIERAIFWDSDGSAQLLDRLEGDNSNIAVGIEDDGSILGLSEEVTIRKMGKIIIIIEDQKAVTWHDGVLTNLNDLVTGGDDLILHFAWDRNDAGQIVGFGGIEDGPPFFSNGWLLDEGIVTDLDMLQRPVAINNDLQIVGYTVGGQSNAYLWDNGVLTNLHDHPSIGGVTSRAFDINDDALIVGEAQFDISKPEEPTIWTKGVPSRLVPEISRPQGLASAVNEDAQVVGWFKDLDIISSDFRGFLWTDGKRVDLVDLIDPAEGWEVLFPFDINDAGAIVGGGRRNGAFGHAFLMIPSACDGDVDGDGVVGFADLLAVLTAWGPCGAGGCAEDLDGSGEVGFGDLLIVLSNWGLCER